MTTKTWDSIIKRLAQHSKQALLDRFVPDATFDGFLPTGLEPVKRSKPRPGKKSDETMALRKVCQPIDSAAYFCYSDHDG